MAKKNIWITCAREMSQTLLTSLLFFAIVVCILSGTASGQSIPQKGDAAMRRVFGEQSALTTVQVPIDSLATAEVNAKTGQTVRGRVSIRQARNAKNEIIGYGIIDDVRGKEQPITYITMIKPDGSIAEVEVLVYRESYGGEVQYESFRKQFRGKRADAQLRVGKDIQNIAGATISSKAITAGAKKLVTLFAALRREQRI